MSVGSTWRRVPSPVGGGGAGALVYGDCDTFGSTLSLAGTRLSSPTFVACTVGDEGAAWLRGTDLSVWLGRSGLPLPAATDLDWLVGRAPLPNRTARPLAAP